MCWEMVVPLAISGGISAIGGNISRGEDAANAKHIADARNKVLTDTMNQNTVLGNDARGHFNNRMVQVRPGAQDAQFAAGAGSRQASIDGNLPTITASTFPGAAESSSLVKGAMAEALEGALSKAHDRTAAQAKLGSYGDVFTGMGLQDNEANRNISTDVNFANANNALLPSLQDFAAQDAYTPNSGLGAVIQGLGSAYGSYAGSH